MDDTLTVQDTPVDDSAADNISLVALTPAEMPEQQRALADWCERKIAAVERELATWRALEDEAVTGGFKHASYTASANRTEKRIVYYRKIKAAIEEGYLIVPNMPINLFAVRVDRPKPTRRESAYRHAAQTATSELLPAGEGRYVDDATYTGSKEEPSTRYDGKPSTRTVYFATRYDENIDFPLRGVHPRVLSATAHAMSLKLFDELGIVQNQGGRDPIVVGRFRDPRGNGRMATFFVAWWLNTSDL